MIVETLVSAVAVLLLLGGCALATVGIYGLLLKPDLFEQLHVAGLVTGPGVILVLLASVGTGSAEIVTSAILMIGFVLVTSSISTHVLAQAGVRRYRPSAGEPGAGQARDAFAAATAGLARSSPAPDVDSGGVLAGFGVPPAASGAAGVRTGRTDDATRAAQARAPREGMRVVVAHDGSAAARQAVELVATIEWPARSVIRVLSVADAPAEAPRPTFAGSADGPATGHRAGVSLESALSELRRGGLDADVTVLYGDPADHIVSAATAFEGDVIVMGSPRRGVVRSLMGRSVAGDVIERAPCPVLVARRARLQEVLLTTDGSDRSLAATELVATWPIFDRTRIRVVTVAANGPRSSARDGGRAVAADQLVLDAAAARLLDAGREVVTEVLHGNPTEQIVEAAQRRSTDLIVIGSRGRTGLGRTLLGSIAGEVVDEASCSVLVVGPPLKRPPATS